MIYHIKTALHSRQTTHMPSINAIPLYEAKDKVATMARTTTLMEEVAVREEDPEVPPLPGAGAGAASPAPMVGVDVGAPATVLGDNAIGERAAHTYNHEKEDSDSETMTTVKLDCWILVGFFCSHVLQSKYNTSKN